MAGEAVYVDTSAFLAVMDTADRQHRDATAAWEWLVEAGRSLVCSNYALTETCALLQRRLGLEALRLFCAEVYPLLDVVWVTKTVHEAGMEAVMVAGRRQLSLVDCVSFIVMRQVGIQRAFAFDAHFAEQGFRCLPGPRP
ncbi:MAG: PIN domain-containing protein [Chloroflexi bacterium]|nr:PIN domain-containing protein [Chloroflexota bacterium]MBI4505038.1 PIN domain-containing protein [Chloroflexota bacterium]